ncbi:hypothetical protein [Micromonospora sp. ATA51]|uniref:hypothetical protein n=1 Tax=Micromonospora sp. ATA51 TaxID=2806098 RepID=UPI001EE4D3B1|nr:hypothetical protein [Micromonospora sp. ATA51]
MAEVTTPRPGDVVFIGRGCSVQFAGERALRMRVVSVDSTPTYHGWIRLTGYVLSKRGEAVNKREVYVMKAGLRIAPAPTIRKPGQRRRVRSRTPAWVDLRPVAAGC